MSLAVVCRFHAVHIRHHDADRDLPPTFQPRQFCFKIAAVIQTCQCIVRAQEPQFLFRPFAGSNIQERADHSHGLAARCHVPVIRMDQRFPHFCCGLNCVWLKAADAVELFRPDAVPCGDLHFPTAQVCDAFRILEALLALTQRIFHLFAADCNGNLR